jgi:hypothetical protein
MILSAHLMSLFKYATSASHTNELQQQNKTQNYNRVATRASAASICVFISHTICTTFISHTSHHHTNPSGNLEQKRTSRQRNRKTVIPGLHVFRFISPVARCSLLYLGVLQRGTPRGQHQFLLPDFTKTGFP